jgi:hypothetical protein
MRAIRSTPPDGLPFSAQVLLCELRDGRHGIYPMNHVVTVGAQDVEVGQSRLPPPPLDLMTVVDFTNTGPPERDERIKTARFALQTSRSA